MPKTLNDIELEIIENGEDDWVLFAHIMGIVAEASQQPLNETDALESASSVCLELCASGFAQLGRYTDREHFSPWPEDGAALKERLRNELQTPPPGIDIELNRMRIMLDILPEGLAAWKRQS